MEEDETKRDTISGPNGKEVDTAPGKNNRDIWDNEEEYDEGWAVTKAGAMKKTFKPNDSEVMV